MTQGDPHAGGEPSQHREWRQRQVAVIGLGHMGLPMAERLLDHGYGVTGFDVAPERIAAAEAAGLEVASDLSRALLGAGWILLSLPNDATVVAAAAEIVAAGVADATVIDTSTISPRASQLATESLAAAGVPFLRVGVSGNPAMIRDGRLSCIVSGPADVSAKAQPLLSSLGHAAVYLGEGEKARIMKLAVNLMVVVTAGMLGEALALGQKSGLDWRTMWDVLETSAIASPVVKAKAPALAAYDFTPTFTVKQMQKDLGLLRDVARELTVPVPLLGVLEGYLEQAQSLGFEAEDYASVIKVVQHASGLRLGAAQPELSSSIGSPARVT